MSDLVIQENCGQQRSFDVGDDRSKEGSRDATEAPYGFILAEQLASHVDAGKFESVAQTKAHNTNSSDDDVFSLSQTCCPSPFPFGYPRSLAEATGVNDGSKFRQLPCRTFISVGSCPYRERCVYLHDPRIAQVESLRLKVKKKNREDIVLDSMFWPCMGMAEVSKKLDARNAPIATQVYTVPCPKDDQYTLHDKAIFSLWNHFVYFCESESQGQIIKSAQQQQQQQRMRSAFTNSFSGSKFHSNGAYQQYNGQASNHQTGNIVEPSYSFSAERRSLILSFANTSLVRPYVPANEFTKATRLQVFIKLSQGRPISAEKVEAVANFDQLKSSVDSLDSLQDYRTMPDGSAISPTTGVSTGSLVTNQLSPSTVIATSPVISSKTIAPRPAKLSSNREFVQRYISQRNTQRNVYHNVSSSVDEEADLEISGIQSSISTSSQSIYDGNEEKQLQEELHQCMAKLSAIQSKQRLLRLNQKPSLGPSQIPSSAFSWF